MSVSRAGALILLLACTGCALFKQPDRFESRPLAFEELPGWGDDQHAQALKTFLASCPAMVEKTSAPASGSNLQVPPSLWQHLCREAKRAPTGDNHRARLFFEEHFTPFRIANNGKETGLFTGYYEPLLYGSRKKKGDYIYPVYAAPAELAKSKPYFSHGDINEGALQGRKLEIAWVDDPVMLFFMQIQGSGRIKLNTGKQMLVGYGGQNGHGYVSVGKVLADEGLMEKDQINFFTLRQWLYDHPDDAFEMMERNPSYVFFKPMSKGPVGSVGVTLTPKRSLAVDSRYIPYGLPLFLETELPGEEEGGQTFRQLLIAQDTGGAIKGPVRGDIFFGHGEKAEYLAGYMKGRGSYNLLVPKEIAYQLQPKDI